MDNECTALHFACEDPKDFGVALELIRNRANVNAVGRRVINERSTQVSYDQQNVYETSLHIALRNQSYATALLLVQMRAKLQIPYYYNNQVIPTLDICKNEQVKKALVEGWSPSSHKYFAKPIRDAIHATLLCFVHKKLAVPKPIIYEILQFAVKKFYELN